MQYGSTFLLDATNTGLNWISTFLSPLALHGGDAGRFTPLFVGALLKGSLIRWLEGVNSLI